MRRELREELGLGEFRLGPLLWRREHTFTWNERRIRQREQFYLVETPRFTPKMSDPVEAKTVDRFAWWALAELATTTETLTPLELAKLLKNYLQHGAPADPDTVERVID